MKKEMRSLTETIFAGLFCLAALCHGPAASAQKAEAEDMSHIKQSAAENKVPDRPAANILVHWKEGKAQAFGTLAELQKVDRPEDVVAIGIQYAGLREIPSVLKRFPNISLLDLSHNNLSCETIAGLGVPRSLKTVYLNDNPLDIACQDKLKSRHPKLQFIFTISQLTQKPE